jgi:molecular chaperone HtpG
MLNEEFDVPKKTLELNPGHPIVLRLSQIDSKDERIQLAVEQVYENALLIEGLMKEPAGMIVRIQKLIEAALK